MFVTVFGVILLVQGIVSVPPFDGVLWQLQPVETPRTYFENFDIEDLNPFNWIPGRKVSAKSDTETKIHALYKIATCLVESDPKQCRKIADEIKPLFEKSKKPNKEPNQGQVPATPPPTTAPNPSTIAPTAAPNSTASVPA